MPFTAIELPKYVTRREELLPRRDRVLTIITAGLKTHLKKPGIIVVVVLGAVLAILPLMVMLFFFSMLMGTELAVFFSIYTNPTTLLFIVLLASIVGSGLISDDISTMSLSLYFSRPITPLDYVVGKTAILGSLLALIAILPGLTASLAAYLLEFVAAEVAGRAGLIFLGVGLLIVAFYTGLALFFSCITAKKKFAGAGVFGVTLGLEVIAQSLSNVIQRRELLYLSPWQNVLRVAASLFEAQGPQDIDPVASLAILLSISATCFLVIYTRLSRIEVTTA